MVWPASTGARTARRTSRGRSPGVCSAQDVNGFGQLTPGGVWTASLRFARVTSATGSVRSVAAQVHDRISIEPDKMDGQPCIRGLRFPVVSVLRMVAGGMTAGEILEEHPDLEPEDIPAALRYAAEALAEHYYPLRPPA